MLVGKIGLTTQIDGLLPPDKGGVTDDHCSWRFGNFCPWMKSEIFVPGI
jgi:hypothetical protein